MYFKAGQRRARRSSLGKFTTLAIWAALANAASAATAYRAIDLTPNGSDSAGARAAGGGWQVGTDDTTGHAILWSGSAASAIDLTPPGRHAAPGAVDATSQGGSVDNHAALWHGSPDSFVDLHPSGYSSSGVSGIGNGQQVGSVATDDDDARTHAALWSGAANTFVDLHPTSGVYSSSYTDRENLSRAAPCAPSGVVGRCVPHGKEHVR